MGGRRSHINNNNRCADCANRINCETNLGHINPPPCSRGGMTFTEIAEMMGLTAPRVRVIFMNGMRKLKEAVSA